MSEAGPHEGRRVRRRRSGYFGPPASDTKRVSASVTHRVMFGEVDVMGIGWHGRYAGWFEEASTEARRLCGLTYEAFHAANLRAPIVQLHVDYHGPVLLDERITVRATMLLTAAARIDTEYSVEGEDGRVAATGYTVQMLTDATTGEVALVAPPLLVRAREIAAGTPPEISP